MTKKIGKLEPVELREVWQHEAKNFTTWLAKNLDVLDSQLSDLDLGLELESTEKSIGSFSADILATAKGDSLVVIENQLGQTNHTHLGQILTYAVNVDAKIVIWISPRPRPEHLKVINWLSDNTSVEFYLVRVQAFKIGDSDPAPLFTLVSGSDEETKDIARVKGDFTKKQKKRFEFWTQLLKKSNAANDLFINTNPRVSAWITALAPNKKRVQYEYNIMMNESRVKLKIWSASNLGEDLEKNTKRYQKLMAHKDEIERAFGKKLIWDFKEDRKAQFISTMLKGGLAHENKWGEIQDAMVETMIKFIDALKPYVRKL